MLTQSSMPNAIEDPAPRKTSCLPYRIYMSARLYFNSHRIMRQSFCIAAICRVFYVQLQCYQPAFVDRHASKLQFPLTALPLYMQDLIRHSSRLSYTSYITATPLTTATMPKYTLPSRINTSLDSVVTIHPSLIVYDSSYNMLQHWYTTSSYHQPCNTQLPPTISPPYIQFIMRQIRNIAAAPHTLAIAQHCHPTFGWHHPYEC
jgi:hypothetical protein